MANRNSATKAIILKTHIQGEHNRNVCALSETDGIFHATLYGGPKSKLSALVQPFSSGKMWIYKDPNRPITKISDFDSENTRLNLRESLYRLFAANLACEIVIKTKAAGEAKDAFFLLNGFLDGLDAIPENAAPSALIRFLWRYLAIMGIQPSTEECSRCGRPFFPGGAIRFAGCSSVYIPSTDGFVCPECAAEMHEGFSLSSEAMAYLAAMAASLSPRLIRAMPLSAASLSQLRQLTFFLSEAAAGMKLKSIESSVGIL